MSATAESLEIKVTPHVKELPLLGSLPGMAKDPAQHFVRCHREYGDVFTMNLLGKKYKVMCGVPAATFMGTREGKECLRSKEMWEGLIKEFGATRSLPGSDGDEHTELREILRRGYSKDSIKGRYGELCDITDGTLERDWIPGSKVPVIYYMQRLVTDQLGTILTGEVPLDYVIDIRTTILYILNCLVTRQRPKFLLMNPEYKRAKQRVLDLSEQMRQDYLNGRMKVKHRTLIDDIMEANRDDKAAMPDENLRLHMVAPYVAGLDTVANTLAACTYTFLKYPEVKRRILEEVDEFFSEPEIDEQGLLKRLPNLNGAIMETMRLYPIAVAQIRTANKDFVFQGHQFTEGEMIYIATCVSHWDDELFPNAYEFDIDRYNKERAEHKQKGAYTVYGRGHHTCLGKNLAEIQLALSMARIFYKLDLSLETPDYVLKTKTAPTPGPAMSFKVKVNGPRKPGQY